MHKQSVSTSATAASIFPTTECDLDKVGVTDGLFLAAGDVGHRFRSSRVVARGPLRKPRRRLRKSLYKRLRQAVAVVINESGNVVASLNDLADVGRHGEFDIVKVEQVGSQVMFKQVQPVE